MGSDQGTSIEPGLPLGLGPCGGCDGPNTHTENCFTQYRARSLILTNLRIYCCVKRRGAKKRAAEPQRPAEEATAKTARCAEEAAEAASNAEEAEKIAAIRAVEAGLKAEKKKAAAKAVKGA